LQIGKTRTVLDYPGAKLALFVALIGVILEVWAVIDAAIDKRAVLSTDAPTRHLAFTLLTTEVGRLIVCVLLLYLTYNAYSSVLHQSEQVREQLKHHIMAAQARSLVAYVFIELTMVCKAIWARYRRRNWLDKFGGSA
jgi:hypothetical protein